MKRRRSSRRNRRPRRWWRWAAWALVLLLLLTLIPVVAWRWLPPPISAVMLQRVLGGQGWPEYEWVSLEQISPQAGLAVVAAEDQRFPVHSGFDLQAMEAAWRHNREGGSLRGASTITQQVAKNLFLWEGRSYLRKGLEAWFTLFVEVIWTKRRILEVYLNIAEMGEGVFGVEAASRRFFRKSAGALAREEAALLAAALPNPRYYRVSSPNAAMVRRRDWILRQMGQLGGPAYLQPLLAPGTWAGSHCLLMARF